MRNALRVSIGLLGLLGAVTTRARADDPAPVDALRLRLDRAVPTLVRLPLDSGRRVTSDRVDAVRIARARQHLRRALVDTHDDAISAWVYLPDGASNRPAVVDLPAGLGIDLPVALTARGSVRVERFLFNDDLVFGGVAGAKPEVYDRTLPHFFLAKIEKGGSAPIALDLPDPGPAPNARVLLKVSLAPTHEGLVQLSATWGSTTLAPVAAVRTDGLSTVSFSCEGKDVARGTPLVLHDATTSIPPTTPDDASDDRGAIWIDAVDVRAPMLAPDDVVRVEVEPDVYARLAIVDASKFATPHVPATDPVAAAKGAAEVILTTQATAAGAARLAKHRSALGVRAVSISFADVVDRIGYGTCEADTVGHYLSARAAAGTAPKFLLLAGDAMRDVGDDPTTTIPTAYVRTMYNGATPSDRALVRTGLAEGVKPPSVGRLPFRDAATMDAYVDRVIAYETKPPADATRRMVRFVTSEGRFGPMIDGLLENLFTNIVAQEIPEAYDVEVTFASPTSAYLWPPAAFHEKVIGALNEGALFYTYVGHGWAQGFDSLHVGARRYPILRSEDVVNVDVRGTPPAMFVVACTTATFDDPAEVGVGERLLARPHGPLAYWGATRICHPAWNAFIGRQLAMTIFKDKDARLGDVIDAAVEGVLHPERDPTDKTKVKDKGRALIEMGARALTPGTVPVDRLLEEGAWMYALLGDPAVRIALPANDLGVTATPGEPTASGDRPIQVVVRGSFPDRTFVEASIEVARNLIVGRELDASLSKDDALRARHASSNDKSIARGGATASGGVATIRLVVPAAWRSKPLFAKASAVFGDDVHQGSIELTIPK